jgi:hypothetical protein
LRALRSIGRMSCSSFPPSSTSRSDPIPLDLLHHSSILQRFRLHQLCLECCPDSIVLAGFRELVGKIFLFFFSRHLPPPPVVATRRAALFLDLAASLASVSPIHLHDYLSTPRFHPLLSLSLSQPFSAATRHG